MTIHMPKTSWLIAVFAIVFTALTAGKMSRNEEVEYLRKDRDEAVRVAIRAGQGEVDCILKLDGVKP